MKKRGLEKIFIFLGFVLLLSGSVFAVLTEVKVKTAPWMEVQVTAFDPYKVDFAALDRFVLNANGYGDVNATLDVNKKFNLVVYIKKDGEKLISGEKFPEGYLDGESYTPGDSIYLEIVPNGYELIPSPNNSEQELEPEEILTEVNSTEEVVVEELTEGNTEQLETESEEIEAEQSAPATGFSVFGDDGLLSKRSVYFIVGFLFLIALAGFTVGIIRKKMANKGDSDHKEIMVKKLSELKKEQQEDIKDRKDDIQDYKKVIEEAEKKIEEAQRDIKKLKNEEKIKEMKKKLEDDEKELLRLREGRD